MSSHIILCIKNYQKSFFSSIAKLSLILILFIATINIYPTYVYASGNGCMITGEVLDIHLGNFTFKSSAESSEKNIRFTEFLLKIISIDTPSGQFYNAHCEKITQQKTISVGLCEEQTIIIGDVIKGNTGGWENGPDCLINVKLISKVKRNKDSK